jgi:hypothetical protein
METNTPAKTESLTWQAPRVPNHERSTGWYIGGGIVVLASAVFGVLSGVWSLAIVCVLCGALYFLVRNHRFPDINCTLNEKGVQIGETFLSWTQVKGYWFLTTSTYTELHVVPNTPRSADLVIQTGTVLPLDIRTFLAGKTDELVEKQEGIIDILLRLTKL